MTAPKPCTCPLARHEHGTALGYSVCGCKCLPCRVAYDAQYADLRAGRRGKGTPRITNYVPSIGTRRRLQALAMVGWSCREIGERLGVSTQFVHKLRTHPRPVQPATAERVARLYDELWDQTPPQSTRWERQGVSHTLADARRHGWHPPLAYDDDRIDDPDAQPWRPTHAETHTHGPIDELAVAEAVHGRKVRLTPAERAAAVQELTARGMSARDVAAQLGTTPRTVTRRRAAA